jgi:hypothetical protein
MNVSVIDWHIFRRALDKQDSAGLDKWLARWVFGDDGVRLSMRSTTQDGFAVERDRAAEKNLCHATAAANEPPCSAVVLSKAKPNSDLRGSTLIDPGIVRSGTV